MTQIENVTRDVELLTDRAKKAYAAGEHAQATGQYAEAKSQYAEALELIERGRMEIAEQDAEQDALLLLQQQQRQPEGFWEGLDVRLGRFIGGFAIGIGLFVLLAIYVGHQ